MTVPKVVILYNEPLLPANHPIAYSEHEILLTVAEVHKHLSAAGFEVTRLGANLDPEKILVGLREHRPDVVFNLFEGMADHGQTEAYAAGLLHWLKVPFTGSPFDTLTLARNKHVTKHLLRGAGLPTPAFFVVDTLPVRDCPLGWPVIVKAALQDASVGLDQGSVVTSQKALEQRAAFLIEQYGPPVLVEEFIVGRELTLGLVEAPELQPLPFSEIQFLDKEKNWPIVTYDAKWKPESADYQATPVIYPAKVPRRLADKLSRIGREVFRLLGCRDYARVDFRVKPGGQPYILEVNPNPDISPEAGLAETLLIAGTSYADFAVQLVNNALNRGGSAPILWDSLQEKEIASTRRKPARRRKVPN